MENTTPRPEILEATKKIEQNNPWYTADQLASQVYGSYKYNMEFRYRYVEKKLKSFPLSGKTVIDLGCGDGQWSIQVQKNHDVELIGVDYNQLRLERYERNVPGARGIFGSCLDIPLDDGFADVIMFHQVLEHIPEPALALQEVRRILKPDGLLILSVPNEGTWLKQSVQYRWIEPLTLKTTDHVNFFTKYSLEATLKANMFNVLQLDTIGFYFPHNGISRRIIRHKWGFRMGFTIAKIFPVFRDCLFAWCRPN